MDTITQPTLGRFARLASAHWARLVQGGPPLEVLHLHQAESTNTLLKDLARAERLSGPALLLADQQTAGRGTRGRVWIQPWLPGARPPRWPVDIALSLALPLDQPVVEAAPEDEPCCDPRLSLVAGAAAAQALEEGVRAGLNSLGQYNDPAPLIGVKWPNDMLAVQGPRAAKTGGILLETIAAGGARWLIAGVGVNVNSLPAEYPTHLAGRVATLRGLMAEVLQADPAGIELDALELAAALGTQLGAALLSLCALVEPEERDTAYRGWMAQWLARDHTPGTPYLLTRDGASTPVTALRLDPATAGLVVADEASREYLIASYTELEPG